MRFDVNPFMPLIKKILSCSWETPIKESMHWVRLQRKEVILNDGCGFFLEETALIYRPALVHRVAGPALILICPLLANIIISVIRNLCITMFHKLISHL